MQKNNESLDIQTSSKGIYENFYKIIIKFGCKGKILNKDFPFVEVNEIKKK